MLPLKDNVPTRTFSVVAVAIKDINVIVWIWEFTGTSVEADVIHCGYYPCKINGPCLGPALQAQIPWYEEAISSMFMHGGWEHIIFNMLFLWIFGNNVEDALGKVRFFLWYISGGLAATLVQTIVTLHYGSAADASIPNIGATGVDLPGHLVRVPALAGRLLDRAARSGRRRGVLRTHRRLRLRRLDDSSRGKTPPAHAAVLRCSTSRSTSGTLSTSSRPTSRDN